jgi:DNA recombination protein RmuC
LDAISFLIGLVPGLLVAGVVFALQRSRLQNCGQAAEQFRLKAEEAEKASVTLSIDLARAETEAKRAVELIGEVGILREELRAKDATISDFQADRARFETTLEERQNALEKQEALLQDAESKLTDTFKALSADALKNTTDEFIKTAQEVLKQHTTQSQGDLEKRQQAIENVVKPLQETLGKYEQQLGDIEKSTAYRASEQTELLRGLQDELEKQRMSAKDLKAILKGPTQRGRMGELQFEVVLQRAGLVRGQHYELQVQTEAGKRPDCVIRLPDDARIIVDIKTPLNSYQDAMELEDETARNAKLDEHARHLRATIDKLAAKEYGGRDEGIVVMYLPIEASLSAALLRDPEITSYGWEKGVVVASPTLFFAFLRSIALAWRQHQLNQNYREIVDVGKQMLIRLRVVTEHFVDLGGHLGKAVRAYENTASSIDRNLYATARRFQTLGVPDDLTKPRRALPQLKEPDAEMKKALRSPLAPREQASLLDWDLTLFDKMSDEIVEPESSLEAS